MTELQERVDRLLHESYAKLEPNERHLMQSVAFVIKLGMDALHWLGYMSLPLGTYVTAMPLWARATAVAWGLGHTGFQLYWRYRLRVLKRRVIASSAEERRELLTRTVEDIGDLQPVLETWLSKRPTGKIGAAYFIEWLAWINFDKRLDQLTEREEEELHSLMPILETKLGPCHETHLQPFSTMLPTIDDFPMEVHPLVVQAVVWGMRKACILALQAAGFACYAVGDVRYLHRGTATEEGAPILFIHGISAGFVPYMVMLLRLASQFPHRQIVLLELPHIAMELTTTIPDRDTTLQALEAIMARHAIASFSLAAHSFGTLVASWILRNRPAFVARVCLVDPVCFRLWDATLARNFLYAEPISFMHDLIRAFVTKEFMTCHSVSREVFWSQMVLFPCDIVAPATVILSAKDWVIDPVSCLAYLKPHIPATHLIDTFHGGFGLNRDFTQQFLDVL